MPAFIAIAILIGLLTAFALAWPLRRAAPAQFAAVLVTLPLLSIGVYWMVGAPASLNSVKRAAPATIAEATHQLEAQLQRDPRQADGWRLLGRAYAEQAKPRDARNAFARAAALAPDDLDIQAEYAESRAKAAPGNRFDREAVATLQRVLQRDPGHQRSRWFLGIAQRQAGDNAAAAATWQPLLAQVDERTVAALRPQIDAARLDAGMLPLPPAAADSRSAGTVGSNANAITVEVSLDPGFAARTNPGGNAQVFVIARAPNGPPMPVAVEKLAVSELPLTVTLDDGDSPMPTQTLSSMTQVTLTARLSADGDAIRQAGDVESQSVTIALPASGPVKLVIGAL